jgi:hypothetical protein
MHRYMNNAHSFDEALERDLKELAIENATEKAAAESKKRENRSGGLQALVGGGPTPLDEVQEIIRRKRLKIAEDLTHHQVRRQMKKMAAKPQRFVDSFLEGADITMIRSK